MSSRVYTTYLNNIMQNVRGYRPKQLHEMSNISDIVNTAIELDDIFYMEELLIRGDGDFEFIQSYDFLIKPLPISTKERLLKSNKSPELVDAIMGNLGELLDDDFELDINEIYDTYEDDGTDSGGGSSLFSSPTDVFSAYEAQASTLEAIANTGVDDDEDDWESALNSADEEDDEDEFDMDSDDDEEDDFDMDSDEEGEDEFDMDTEDEEDDEFDMDSEDEDEDEEFDMDSEGDEEDEFDMDADDDEEDEFGMDSDDEDDFEDEDDEEEEEEEYWEDDDSIILGVDSFRDSDDSDDTDFDMDSDDEEDEEEFDMDSEEDEFDMDSDDEEEDEFDMDSDDDEFDMDSDDEEEDEFDMDSDDEEEDEFDMDSDDDEEDEFDMDSDEEDETDEFDMDSDDDDEFASTDEFDMDSDDDEFDMDSDDDDTEDDFKMDSDEDEDDWDSFDDEEDEIDGFVPSSRNKNDGDRVDSTENLNFGGNDNFSGENGIDLSRASDNGLSQGLLSPQVRERTTDDKIADSIVKVSSTIERLFNPSRIKRGVEKTSKTSGRLLSGMKVRDDNE